MSVLAKLARKVVLLTTSSLTVNSPTFTVIAFVGEFAKVPKSSFDSNLKYDNVLSNLQILSKPVCYTFLVTSTELQNFFYIRSE